MRVLDLTTDDRVGPECVVTIGVYDGVHRGHRHIVDEVRRRAASEDLASGVVTFDRHPASIVRPGSAPRLLTTFEQKLELLGKTGIDFVLVVPFDQARSNESAERFSKTVLADRLGARQVVVGADFHFGRNREGDVQRLEQIGAEDGFIVVPAPLLEENGAPISSTRIRALLADGDTAIAATLLGRPHELRGTVIHGDKRGRELGFPTANVAVDQSMQLPADGIYAGWYERPNGDQHVAAINLGRRPTFYDSAEFSLLEAHLLDFDDDLYEEQARVRFGRRLRPELKFESIDDLVRQMQSDVDQVRRELLI